MKPIVQRNTIAEILEIPPVDPIDLDLAKSNYKRLIKQYHPDVNKEEGVEEYCKKLNWAIGVVTGKIKVQRQVPPPPPQYQEIRIVFTGGFGGGWYTETGYGFNYNSETQTWSL